MADTPKVLSQDNPSAATLTLVYTVPASRSAILSSIVVANRSSTDTTFRISIAVASAEDSLEQYIYYDHTAYGNETFIATIGLTLATTDEVWVYATLATLSFSLFGAEIA